MNKKTLNAAVAAAEAFLARVNDLQDSLKGTDQSELWVGSMRTGAVKRASMDLTRALADLRRPG